LIKTIHHRPSPFTTTQLPGPGDSPGLANVAKPPNKRVADRATSDPERQQ
jgi:hypothetical protein